nr:MAG: hypothetical protein [Chemarfal virus 43]
MSNPIAAQTSSINLNSKYPGTPVMPDPVFSTQERLDELREQASLAWGLEGTLQMVLKKASLELAPSVLMRPAVDAGMVFNAGALTRPLAITQDLALTLRRRTLLGTCTKNLVIASVCEIERQEGPVPTVSEGFVKTSSYYYGDGSAVRADVEKACEEKFYAAGGTQLSMGRLNKALHEVGIRRLKPITAAEADRAYYHCGLVGPTAFGDWGNIVDDLPLHLQEWPLVRGDAEGASVQISMNSDLGFPYLAKGREEAAFERCLGTVKWMRENGWNERPVELYHEAMVRKPGFVLFMGKTKADIYSREKIEKNMMRFYHVMPGHLKFFLATTTQPFGKLKRTLIDVRERDPGRLHQMHSMQKVGMIMDMPKRIANALDAQLERGPVAWLHCGDDTLVAMWVVRRDQQDGADYAALLLFKIDLSNFDLTQRLDVTQAVDDRIAQGLAQISGPKAALWAAIMRSRLVLINRSGVVTMRGVGASGLPLQSEKNDLIMEVFCRRLADTLEREQLIVPVSVDLPGGPITKRCLRVTKAQLDNIIDRTGADLGLTARVEETIYEPSYHILFGPDDSGNPFTSGEAPVFCTLSGGDQSQGISVLGFRLMATKVTRRFAHHTVACVVRDDYGLGGGNDLTRPGIVAVPDSERFALSLMYPRKTWVKDAKEFHKFDLVRVASIVAMYGALLYTHQGFAACNMLNTIGQWIGKERQRLKLGVADEHRYIAADVEVFGGIDGGNLPLSDDPMSISAWIDNLVTALDPNRECRSKMMVPPTVEAPIGILDSILPGSRWADVVEETTGHVSIFIVAEQWLESFRTMAPMSLGSLALRAATRANWGRPPPNVPVRNPMGDGIARGLVARDAHGPVAGGGSGLTKGQRRRRNKRAKAGGGENHDAIMAASNAHLEEQRIQEQEALDDEEAYRLARLGME